MSVSKSMKPILISVIVIAVVALLLVVFLVIFPEPEPVVEEVSATPTVEPATYIIKEDGDSLVQIKAYYDDGETLTVKYDRDEEGDIQYVVEPAAKFFDYNTSKFRSMMFTLTSLTAIEVIAEKTDDLAQFGLEDPMFRMEMTFDDGRVINLYIGDTAAVDYYYYAKTDESDRVYTIGNYLTGLISRSELEYRDIPSFPQYTEDDIYSNINWFRLTQKDGTVVEVTLDSEFNIEGNKASSLYMMLSPVLSSCTDELVQEKVLDIAATLTYADVVGDITADQLKEYGFDKATRFELGDVEGNRIDLVVGGAASAGQSFVAMGEQYDAFMNGQTDELMVLRYSSEAFSCIEVEYTTLLNRAIWIQDIHSVGAIVYDMAGEVYTLEMEEYDDVTGSGVDVVRTVGTLNGKEVTETNTKRLFSRTLNLREVGELDRSIELGEPEYTITLKLRDGGSRTLEMIKLNERQYACRVDGKAEFYIYKSNIQTLMTAITRIMDDRNVSLVYTT